MSKNKGDILPYDMAIHVYLSHDKEPHTKPPWQWGKVKHWSNAATNSPIYDTTRNNLNIYIKSRYVENLSDHAHIMYHVICAEKEILQNIG